MNPHLDCILHDLPAPPRYRQPFYLPPPPSTVYAPSSSSQQYDWRSQAQHSTLFAGPLAPSSWTNAGPSHVPSSLWPAGPPDFLLPFHHYPTKQYGTGDCRRPPLTLCRAPQSNLVLDSVARSDTSSAISRDSDLSPSPEVAEVVCNAPLVAPVPLPYHSPTFLMYDLPDEDEDLSHPPYTHRPHKRKRARNETDSDAEDDQDSPSSDARGDKHLAAKRRAVGASGATRWNQTSEWGSALRHPATGFSRRNRAR